MSEASDVPTPEEPSGSVGEVGDLVRRLESGVRRTMARLDRIPADYLGSACRHNCARGATVWDLLTHNIEHDRMHTGQVVGARDDLRRLQQDPKVRLAAELYVSRAMLIASLFGLDDADIDVVPKGDEWTIRQVIDHVLHWEEDSMSDLVAQHTEEQHTEEKR